MSDMSVDSNSNNELPNKEYVYTIGGVKVEFPAKAYPSQISMMDKIIRGCHRAQNCLLESPTGSGKTLALLCGALAWQKAEIKKLEDAFKKEFDEYCRTTTLLQNEHYAALLSDAHQKLHNGRNAAVNDLEKTVRVDVDEFCCSSVVSTACVSDGDEESDLFYPSTNKKKLKYESNKSTTAAVAASAYIHHNEALTVDHDDDAASTDNHNNVQSNRFNFSLNHEFKNTNGAGSKEQLESLDLHAAIAAPGKPKAPEYPKIYFGTRTHKQIAQVVHELRRTKYNDVKITVLSSRTHSCISDRIHLNSNKDELCRELNDPMTGSVCFYKTNVKSYCRHNMLPKELPSIWDLEDLVRMGNAKNACPYFTARELMISANVIFCPYNYLLDPLIRKNLNITLHGAVLILDEAHNVEDTCREAASFSLEQNTIIEAMANCEEVMAQASNATPFQTLIRMLRSVNEWINEKKGELDEVRDRDYDRSEKTIFGPEAVRSFSDYDFAKDKYRQLEVALKEIEAERETNAEENRGVFTVSGVTKSAVEGLLLVLGYLYDDRYTNDFYVAITRNFSHHYNNEPEKDSRGWMMSGRKKKHTNNIGWTYAVHFWCLNPAVVFCDIKEKARSIILTSGTLSPIDSFQSELGATFPITLEANHVIDSDQCWIGSLCTGPSTLKLDGTFRSTSTYEFQDEIGSILNHVCSLVPHGILCFVPSYTLLDKLKERWHFTGLAEKLERHKMLLWEPRRGDQLQNILEHFYQRIEETAATAIGCGVTGVLFVAVCRGKVSEGLDFADKNARLVVTIGIPFPHLKDTQVSLKKLYNDKHRYTKGLLNGGDWYQIQAYRALNQALGRCIRHKSDWGAILLLDSRFSNSQYYKGLSKWVRNRAHHFREYSAMAENLSAFFHARLKLEESDQSPAIVDF